MPCLTYSLHSRGVLEHAPSEFCFVILGILGCFQVHSEVQEKHTKLLKNKLNYHYPDCLLRVCVCVCVCGGGGGGGQSV